MTLACGHTLAPNSKEPRKGTCHRNYSTAGSTKKTEREEPVVETPRTKLQIVYAIKDLLGITERGVMEVYEFEAMRKPSLVALYQALKVGRV